MQCRHIKKRLYLPTTTHPNSFRPIQHHVCNGLYQCFPHFYPWTNPHIIFHIPRNAYYGNVHRSEEFRMDNRNSITVTLLSENVCAKRRYISLHVLVYCTAISEALSIAHEDYSSNGHCRTKIPATVNPLIAELNPTCHLLALVGAHHIVHVRVKWTFGITHGISRFTCIYSTSAHGTPNDVLLVLV